MNTGSLSRCAVLLGHHPSYFRTLKARHGDDHGFPFPLPAGTDLDGRELYEPRKLEAWDEARKALSAAKHEAKEVVHGAE